MLPDLDVYKSEFKRKFTLNTENPMIAAGIDKSIDQNLGFAQGIKSKFSSQNFSIKNQKLGKDMGERKPTRF